MGRALGKIQRERIYVSIRRYFYDRDSGTAEDMVEFIKQLEVIDKDNAHRHRFSVPTTHQLAYVLKYFHHPILDFVRTGWNGSRAAVYGRSGSNEPVRNGSEDICAKRRHSKVPEMCSTQDGYQQGNIQGRSKSSYVVHR